MVLAGVEFWYDNYGLWPWQAQPRPKTGFETSERLAKSRTQRDNQFTQSGIQDSNQFAKVDIERSK